MSNTGKNRDYEIATEEVREHMAASHFPWYTTFDEAGNFLLIALLGMKFELGGGATKAVSAGLAIDQHGKPFLFGIKHEGTRFENPTVPLYEMRDSSVDELMSAAENCCGMTSNKELARLEGKSQRRISPLEFYLESMILTYGDADHPWERIDGGEDRHGLALCLCTPDGSLASVLTLSEFGTIMLSLFDISASDYTVDYMCEYVRLVKFFDDVEAAINEAVRMYDEATK